MRHSCDAPSALQITVWGRGHISVGHVARGQPIRDWREVAGLLVLHEPSGCAAAGTAFADRNSARMEHPGDGSILWLANALNATHATGR